MGATEEGWLYDLMLNTYSLLTDTTFWLMIGTVLIKILVIYIVAKVVVSMLKKAIEQEENMVVEPTVMGVQDLGDSDVVIRVAAECNPMTHFAIARKLRRAIKDRFDQKGIEIPYPRLVTYRREE